MTQNRKVSTQYGMNMLGFFMVVIFAKTLKLLLHDPMGFAPFTQTKVCYQKSF